MSEARRRRAQVALTRSLTTPPIRAPSARRGHAPLARLSARAQSALGSGVDVVDVDVVGALDDELLAGRYVIAHEQLKDVIGLGRIINGQTT